MNESFVASNGVRMPGTSVSSNGEGVCVVNKTTKEGVGECIAGGDKERKQRLLSQLDFSESELPSRK